MTPLPTWRYLAGMARYAPRRYLLHGGLWGVMDLASLLPGLIARARGQRFEGKKTVFGEGD